MRRLLGLALAVGLGCGHDAKPIVQPDDHPPLPPGTPVGYLIDDASELQLRDDQIARLKEIDSALAGQLDVLDADHHRPAASASAGSGAGGRHRGGRRGGMRRGGAGGGSGSAAARPAVGSAGGATAAASGKTEERADDVRAAIARAFAVLDVVQRVIARRVLSDHGVDVDAGRPEPGHSEGEPDEPDTGSDGSDGR
jgi:hypothetical protein